MGGDRRVIRNYLEDVVEHWRDHLVTMVGCVALMISAWLYGTYPWVAIVVVPLIVLGLRAHPFYWLQRPIVSPPRKARGAYPRGTCPRCQTQKALTKDGWTFTHECVPRNEAGGLSEVDTRYDQVRLSDGVLFSDLLATDQINLFDAADRVGTIPSADDDGRFS